VAAERDYYTILQVIPDAEPEVIEAAYRRLTRKYHPDVNSNADATRRQAELNEAWETLRDPARRRAYDDGRGSTRGAATSPWRPGRPAEPPWWPQHERATPSTGARARPRESTDPHTESSWRGSAPLSAVSTVAVFDDVGAGREETFLLSTSPEGEVYAARNTATRSILYHIAASGALTTLLSHPRPIGGICADGSGGVYLTDTGLNCIYRYAPNAELRIIVGPYASDGSDEPVRTAYFDPLSRIVADRDGKLFVAERRETFSLTGRSVSRVRVIDPHGSVKTLPAQFRAIGGLAIGLDGMVVISDSLENRIVVRGMHGARMTMAGSKRPGNADGPARAARFNGPHGVAIDTAGNVYVADTGNHAIRRISSHATVSTLAGAGVAGHVDGLEEVARFNAPTDVAAGPNGDLFVADQGNRCIRRIVLSRVVR
jgi:DNA-binding beta-propeller fold protein YncE